ncbi:MAG: CDP-diacylglycerol--glycerol-3-phosphate 3-phosphatidyltransferase, partial [Rhodobacteraceae bacterium]|nr:CDP-diacylglycerol--glycerol-3-phosphate 3-phosphatidyltransferase [Paracoccaceae bacterium]
LDPIADKAMVVIALLVITGFSGMNPWILLPATLILFREVFVSGLREYMGDKSRLLKVTWLAKWKTTAQMIAIAVLFANGVFEHYFGMQSFGMDGETVVSILSGETDDLLGLRWKYHGMVYSFFIGVTLLWIAAVMTLLSGADYLAKAMPHLREGVR